ncbi:MAG TPA: hypothetical protein VGA95_13470 [Thermodesulfobacteriota bacterium]
MRIVIIGWGSVIWDPRDLPREGIWQSEGPRLPIEFSRVSRGRRLTGIIDYEHGTDVETKYVISPRVDIDDAIEDLRVREDTVKKHIGFVDNKHNIASDTAHSNDRRTCETVKRWLAKTDFLGAVWTALRSNFREETGRDFSVEHGVEYIRNLPTTARQQALKYIRNAPTEVDTPLRRKLLELRMLEKCS